jgi:nucleoside-diphosphate-sugar epimerase
VRGMRLAVLGATGHVGKALVSEFASDECEIAAFARSRCRLEAFLSSEGLVGRVHPVEIDDFGDEPFDLVVDCVGMTDPRDFGPGGRDLLALTERTDEILIRHAERHPGSRYVYMSSGAAYLSDFNEPAGVDNSPPSVLPSGVRAQDLYGFAKAASERRHRGADRIAIVDLRLFGFLSRFVDVEGGYLMSEVVRCLRSGRTLVTDDVDVVRDYVSSNDLASLVRAIAAAPHFNGALDVYSAAPARKSEILATLTSRFGLSYTVEPEALVASGTGRKPCYYSTDHSAARFGYVPRSTTLQCVVDVTARLVGGPRG